MKKLLVCLCVAGLATLAAQGQVQLSGGLTYFQDFDTLASTSTGTTVPWTDNSTLPGWYASRAYTASGGIYGPYPYTSYRVSGGESTSGWIYSFGTNGVGPITDRAFGSISSGTPSTNAWGLRMVNDTAQVVGNATLSYTVEQWRNGGNVNTQYIYFTFRTSSSPITDPTPGNETGWTSFPTLDTASPTVGATATPLDGNDPANQVKYQNVTVPNVTLNPGDEVFFRWYDINDTGNDHGFGVDNLTVNFTAVPEPSGALLFGLGLVCLAYRKFRG